MKLAVITARGGSKRIPRKNIRDFCGKPIIAYSIQAALDSNCFNEVMVSTDDDEIAEIARKYGAKVPFIRSSETSDDFATTADVLFEVVNKYQKRKIYPEYLCCLYPTAPLIIADNLISAFNQLQKNQMDVVFPITRFSFPIQRALRLQENKVSFFNPENASMRSQDLEPAYHDAGQFYWCCVKTFLETKSLSPVKTSGIILPEWQVQDLDNMDDWVMAEMKYRLMHQEENV